MMSLKSPVRPKLEFKPSADTKSQDDEELTMVRRELEITKNALKHQEVRCRHLVTAFTKKLAEKDKEIKDNRELRDRQLSGLIRALLVLEARLKKEQKTITCMLVEKDKVIKVKEEEMEKLRMEKDVVIRRQEEEIERLRAEVKGLGVGDGEGECGAKEETELELAKPDLISSLGIEPGAGTPSPCQPSTPSPSHSHDSPCQPDSLSSDSTSTKACLGDDNDFVCQTDSPNNNIKEDPQFTPFVAPENTFCPAASPQLVIHDRSAFSPVPARKPKQEYQDNPVLQCVNQILLKDQEDMLAEQGRSGLRLDEDGPEDAETWTTAEPDPSEKERQHKNTQQPSAKQNEVEKVGKEPRKPMLMNEINKRNPPLPPKPRKVKRVEFATTVEFHNPQMVFPPPRLDTAELEILHKQPSIPLLDTDDGEQDNELYVISNSALDDDIVQELQGRRPTAHHRTQHSNVPNGRLHPSHKPQPRDNPNNLNILSVSQLFTGINNNVKSEYTPCYKSPQRGCAAGAIRMASPVASLLASVSPVVAENDSKCETTVSEMVRRFEDLGTKEEGKDEVESQTSSAPEEPEQKVSYDNFLEATGLSNKSIMTPSRMLNNHRSVMKPKDVKLRSKVRSAGLFERAIPAQVVGPTVKYWTEPYL